MCALVWVFGYIGDPCVGCDGVNPRSSRYVSHSIYPLRERLIFELSPVYALYCRDPHIGVFLTCLLATNIVVDLVLGVVAVTRTEFDKRCNNYKPPLEVIYFVYTSTSLHEEDFRSEAPLTFQCYQYYEPSHPLVHDQTQDGMG